MRIVDFRSDTVTHPSPEMRQAMFEAEVGDDVHRDDPTVLRLEEMAADEKAASEISVSRGEIVLVLRAAVPRDSLQALSSRLRESPSTN